MRAEQGLGVMMLDLDHFKKFNDTHGHEAGETVLRETASFLLKSVRAEDIVCRFGGEEFVVILPVAD
jgi:diguanylate cyclase (GGDEF)-like protein